MLSRFTWFVTSGKESKPVYSVETESFYMVVNLKDEDITKHE